MIELNIQIDELISKMSNEDFYDSDAFLSIDKHFIS